MMYLLETLKVTDTKRIRGGIVCVMFVLILLPVFAFSQQNEKLEVLAKNPEVEAASIYQIVFSIDEPIPQNAEIRVTFPEQFDLSELSVAGSNTINGGFDVEVSNQNVKLTRSGLGREINPNEEVDVKFAIVKNPTEPNDQYLIEVEVVVEEQESIFKKESQIKIVPKKE